MKKYYTALSALLLLTACSKSVDLETMSAEEIYNYAMDELEKTRYAKAETAFEALETDHPYSQWAVRSKLMSAYAYYKDEKYDEAVMAVDRFIKYHPGNKDVPYALYLKGMCYYDQISSADKDQGNTQKAAEAFALLMVMYPESEYAKDAAGKINLTEDYKAGQEMIVGRYYLHEGNYLSALNRFNVVLENYQKTIQIEEALFREVEIYAIFGLNNYANGYFKILQENYPDGKWTAKAEKIMKKIGIEVQPSKAKAKPKKEQPQKVEAESKGWFSGWFGSDDEDKAEEVKTEATEETSEVKDGRKGWFSGWFGGDDEDKAEEAEIQTTEQVAVVKDDSKGWFSGWFGGSEDEAEAKVEKAERAEVKEVKTEAPAVPAKAQTERQSWFDGWFGDSEDKVEEMKPVAEMKAAPVAEYKDATTIADEERQAATLERMVSKSDNQSKGIGNEGSNWYNDWFGESKSASAKSENKAVTERQSWFEGWFGGSKDKAEEGKADVVKKVEDVKNDNSDDGKTNTAQSKNTTKATSYKSVEEMQKELQKIVDTDDSDAEEAVEPKERRRGWFNGWFHGGSEIRDDMAESKKAANETINESLDQAREESENVVDTADKLQKSAEDAAKPKEKKRGWFGGLFGGGTVMGGDNAE